MKRFKRQTFKKGDRIRIKENNKFWKGFYYAVHDINDIDYENKFITMYFVNENKIFSPDVYNLDFQGVCCPEEAVKCEDQKIESFNKRLEIINKFTPPYHEDVGKYRKKP